MKWGFTFRNKLKLAIVLLVVLAAMFLKSVVEERHVSTLGKSFESFYKDRLLVEGYIYRMSNHLHVKKMITDNCTQPSSYEQLTTSLQQQNDEIGKLMIAYEKTQLTDKEAVTLRKLKADLHTLQTIEHSYLNRVRYNYEVGDLKAQMAGHFTNASENLQRLSEIQLAVGKDMQANSEKILSESSLFSQFGLTILIVIGLIIQVLVFSSKDSIASKSQPNAWMN